VRNAIRRRRRCLKTDDGREREKHACEVARRNGFPKMQLAQGRNIDHEGFDLTDGKNMIEVKSISNRGLCASQMAMAERYPDTWFLMRDNNDGTFDISSGREVLRGEASWYNTKILNKRIVK